MKIAGEITREQLEAAKQRMFVKEAWASVRDADVLGILLSQCLHYDGYEILKACSAALEDANFHRENEKLQKMFPQAFSKNAFA
jgi:hypothetical protein